jgi:hypothetical protein
MMNDTAGRPLLLASGLAFALVSGACSGAPAPSSDPDPVDRSNPIHAHYLRPESTIWSRPIGTVGDVDLLGADSVMRESLVAGDESLVVVATVFRVDEIAALDLIVLNQAGEPVRLAREDLHLVDAGGVWLPSVEGWEEGRGFGLRARQGSAAAALDEPETPMPSLLDDPSTGMAFGDRVTAVPKKRDKDSLSRPAAPVPRPRTVDSYQNAPSVTRERASSPDPAEILVPGEDGRPFWAYFEAAEAAYPLTAVVMIGDEQLLFRFDQP